MNLKPLNTVSRSACGVNFGMAIYKNRGKEGASKTSTLEFSIHPSIIKKMKANHGDIFRLDGDAKEGVIQLTPVLKLGPAARKIRLNKAGRGYWAIPYNGMVSEVIKATNSLIELTVIQITSEGPLLKLP